MGRCSIFIIYRPAQRGVQDWKARISIRSFTSPESNSSIPLPSHTESPVLSPSHLPESSTFPSLTSHLCYACHTTLTSRSSRGTTLQAKNSTPNHSASAIPLPVWVSSRLIHSVDRRDNREVLGNEDTGLEVWQSNKMGTTEMKDAVKDFLLED